MPKHVPTFKHLLYSTHPAQRPVEAVEEPKPRRRLASRHIPPHIVGENVWSPSTSGRVDAALLVDLESGGVHPAELLRRFNQSRWQASRSVAGPAPPPSWHASSSSRTKSTPAIELPTYPPVTGAELNNASSLLSHQPNTSQTTGTNPRLMEFCFKVVLRHMEDEQVIYAPEEGETGGSEEDVKSETYTMGRLLREQVAYLEPHLKAGLLDTLSLLPESVPRIGDRSYRAILSDPPPDMELDLGTADESEEDWDVPGVPSLPPTHIPLTLHPSPHILLRHLPLASSLTSLNLAYSTLPEDFEALVGALPPGLRELSLAGARVGKRADMREDGVRRGMSRLGRKLIVLHTLDISYPRYPMSWGVLASLLQPADSHLPSLKRLGVRGIIPLSLDVYAFGGNAVNKDEGGAAEAGDQEGKIGVHKAELLRLVRVGRRKYVDAVWE
ncbi:hypothetical protein IAT38_008184 [Cryptococcus sp. DSM 104549]